MNTPPKLSFVCPLPWESMSGDERSRFCATCRHQIRNLSLIGPSERNEVLELAKTQRVCGTYFVRLSGELVTPDKPLTERESGRIRQYGVAALSAAALVVASGCVTHSKQAQVHVSSPGQVQIEPKDDVEKQAEGKLKEDGDEEVVLLTGFIICDPQETLKMHGPHAE